MQLEWMIQLQNYRNNYLDFFFRFLHFFDTIYFIYILVPFIVIGISYRWGVKIYYLIVVNGLINYGLKILFKIPRPSVINPDLALVNVKEYSFPSGAAQFSIVLASLLIYFWKSPLAKIIGVSYVILIGFSRVYLGVHYPTDIIIGWTVGLVVVMVFFKSGPVLEKIITKNALFSFITSFVLTLAFILFFSDIKTIQFSSSFLGILIGSAITFKYNLYMHDAKKVFSSVLRGAIAILSTFVLYSLFSQINLQQIIRIALENIVLSIWIVLGISPVLKKLLSNH